MAIALLGTPAWSQYPGGPAGTDFSDTGNASGSGAIDTSSASLLVAACGSYGAVAITDSKGNTWNPLTAKTNGYGGILQLFWTVPTVKGTGHTFRNTGVDPSLIVAAFSGTDTVSPFDKESGAINAATTNDEAPGAVTPTNDNSLVIGASTFSGAALWSAVDGGYTDLKHFNQIGSQAIGLSTQYVIQGVKASANAGATANSSDFWASVQAVFIPAGSVVPDGLEWLQRRHQDVNFRPSIVVL
jgi:hypothetical protein